eukprot:664887-Prorocentrum_minimum.AAC.1
MTHASDSDDGGRKLRPVQGPLFMKDPPEYLSRYNFTYVMSKGKKKMEIYGSDTQGGVLHEGGSLNGLSFLSQGGRFPWRFARPPRGTTGRGPSSALRTTKRATAPPSPRLISAGRGRPALRSGA